MRWWVLGTIVLAFLYGSSAWAAGVDVSVGDETVAAGQAVSVEISNGARGAIHLPACGAVVFEIFEEGVGYRELPPPSCRAEVNATPLRSGKSTTLERTPEVGDRAILRPIVTYGVGCRDELPLDRASCKSIQTVRGRFFTVSAPAPSR